MSKSKFVRNSKRKKRGYVIMRVDDLELRPSTSIDFSVLVAAPKTVDMPQGKAFMTAYFAWVREGSSGSFIGNPPLHVHHFIEYTTGFVAPKDLAKWPYWTERYVPDFINHGQPTRTADSLCDTRDDPFACAMYTYPRGTGRMKQKYSDMWQLIRLDNPTSKPLNLTVEIAGKWVIPLKGGHEVMQAFDVNFHTNGFSTAPYEVAARVGESMAWRTFTLPSVSGGFGHILMASFQVKLCCSTYHVKAYYRSASPQLPIMQHSTPLGPLGLDANSIRADIDYFYSHSVKCRFKVT